MAFAVSYFKHFSRTLAHDLADKHSRTLSSTTPTIKTQDCPTPNSAQKKEKDAAKKRLGGDIATDGEARATPHVPIAFNESMSRAIFVFCASATPTCTENLAKLIMTAPSKNDRVNEGWQKHEPKQPKHHTERLNLTSKTVPERKGTYNMRVGRSAKITGPYLDKDNKDMLQSGGTLLLGTDGPFIGPGHAGILKDGERYWLSMHFYDGTTQRGTSALAIRPLKWSPDGWPVVE